MASYAVTAARFGDDGELERVRWVRVDGADSFDAPVHDVPVDIVVAAIERGDSVELRFSTARGHISGGHLVCERLPGRSTTVREALAQDGFMLRDLPDF